MWLGAWFLALIAGMVNVVGLLGFEHQALTHMTGLTSRFSQDLAQGHGRDASIIAMIMVSFVAGAALSGLLVVDDALALGRRYGVVLLIEATLLAIATLLLDHQWMAGFCLAALACGLQNAMVAHFSGSVIRTTHVSGMFTDIGASIGHWLRGAPVDRMRLKICASTISGFGCGSLFGAAIYQYAGTRTLFVPAILALILATAYRGLIRRNKRNAAPIEAALSESN